MSPQTIEMRFQEIVEVEQSLNELAKELESAAGTELMQLIRDIRRSWNSICADRLTGKEAELAAELTDEAQQLKKLASQIRRRAEEMYRWETVNRQVAVTRLY